MNRRSLLYRMAMVAMVLIIAPTNFTYAQSVASAQISGAVTDPSGAQVQGAKIIATQTNTNQTRTTISGSDGSYVLPSLPIGPYKLEVDAQGFSTYIETGIILQVGESPRINITLAMGRVTQQVEVSTDAPAVQTDTASVSQVIDNKRMVDMPLNGRQATQLIMLSGAANDVGPHGSDLLGSKNYFSADSISVAGGQASSTHYLLDGGENMDTFSNVNLPLPFPDALQEFSVETSALSARYGMQAGAVVNAVTKSGTNHFHGNLFEYVRNGATNAIDYFAKKQDSLKRNQYGGTLGGPILKDKVFGFFGYQQTSIRTAPPTSISYVPTQAVLNGDFSQFESAGCQSSGKARTITDPSTGQPFVNSYVNPLRFNQQALNFLKHVPVSTDPCGRFIYALPEPQSEQQILGRVDSTLNEKNSLFGHVFVGNYSSPSPYDDKNILLTKLRGVTDHSLSVVLGDTYTIGPRMVNSAHLAYTRLAILRGPTGSGINLKSLGVNIPYQPLPNYLSLNVSGHFGAGCGTCATADLTQNNIQFADDVDIALGRHHISTGIEWVNFRSRIDFSRLAAAQVGFNGQFSNDALLDFMLGLPNNFQQGNIQAFDGRQNYFGGYVHDVVRFSKRITGQLGVRWEPNLWGGEASNRMHHFDQSAFNAGRVSTQFPNAPAGLLFPGDSGVPSSFTANNYLKFEPRAGLAWDPTGDGRQVIRAGYGLFYEIVPLGYWEDVTEDAPWGNSITLNSPQGGFSNPYAGYPGGSPFPSQQPPPQNVTFPSHGSYISYPTHAHQTYTNAWNLSYEVQPFKDWVFSAGYIGNKTTHIWGGVDVNAAVYIPGMCNGTPCSTTSNTDKRRALYLQNPARGGLYSDIFQAFDGANASYHALLVKGEHRFNNHYTVLVNYTYSHCITEVDFIGDLGGSQAQDQNNPKAEHGNCGFDIRHGVNISSVLESPRLKNHLADKLIGTWKLAPIITLHSGTWFSPITGKDNSLTGVGNDRPNQVGNPYVRNLKALQWLDPNAYMPNPIGTFGNAGNDSLVGPGFVNIDAALSRAFNIREHQEFDLRFEAFNLANHPNFSNPDGNRSDSTFGIILSDAGPRILQFAAKYQF